MTDTDKLVDVHNLLKGKGVTVIVIGRPDESITKVITDGGKIVTIDSIGPIERVVSTLVGKCSSVSRAFGKSIEVLRLIISFNISYIFGSIEYV